MTPESRAVFERIATWLERGAPHKDARGMTFNMEEIILLKPLE